MPHQGVPALVAIGDSLTYNNVYSVTLEQFYPHRVAAAIAAKGITLTPFNYGVAGDSTSAILSRAAAIAADGIPEVCIVWGGTNDALDSVTTWDNLAETARTINSPRTLLVGNHFNNFATNGDEVGNAWPRWRRLRLKQKRAAYIESLPYVDLHGYMQQLLIDNPSDIGNDTLWNVATGNTHLNAAGEQVVADAIFRKIKSLGWLNV